MFAHKFVNRVIELLLVKIGGDFEADPLLQKK